MMVTSTGPGYTKLQGIVPAVVYACFLFSLVTDRGVVPWLEYEQMALTGSYSPFMSPLLQSITAAPVCAVVVAMMVGAVEKAFSYLRAGGGVRPSMRSGATERSGEERPAPSSMTRVPLADYHPPHPPTGAAFQFRKLPAPVPLPPVGEAAYRTSVHAKRGRRFPAVLMICAVALTAIAWVSIRSILQAAHGPDPYTHEVIDLSRGISPHGSHVELVAVEHPGMAVVVTQDGGKYGGDRCRTFTPLLPLLWKPGMPIKYFEESETSSGGCSDNGKFTRDIDLVTGRYVGRLAHMSGVAIYDFTSHGITIDAHPVALKSDINTDSADIAFALSLVGALTFWTTFLIYLFQYFRSSEKPGNVARAE
jgi:hypothetical protein